MQENLNILLMANNFWEKKLCINIIIEHRIQLRPYNEE